MLQKRLNVVHMPLPGLNVIQAMSELLKSVNEPHAAFAGDDDFLVPSSLEKCAGYLDTHPDFSLAYGFLASFTLESLHGAYGEVTFAQLARWRPVEQQWARKRLLDFSGNPFANIYAVHRIEEFRTAMDASLTVASSIPFTELLTSCISIVRGKAKQLECLYLVRQHHDRFPHPVPDVYEWFTGPAWFTSYQIFRETLAGELAQQDELSMDEAGEVVKQAFWSYLVDRIPKGWHSRYGQKASGVRARLREVAKSISPVRNTWRQLQSRRHGGLYHISLETLLKRSSPFHADFMPVYRGLAAPAPELNGSTAGDTKQPIDIGAS